MELFATVKEFVIHLDEESAEILRTQILPAIHGRFTLTKVSNEKGAFSRPIWVIHQIKAGKQIPIGLHTIFLIGKKLGEFEIREIYESC